MTELAGIESAEELARVTQVSVDRWYALQPPGEEWSNLVGGASVRAETIKNLRDLADFLEARPEIPVPAYGDFAFNVFASGTDEEKRAQVDYAGTLLDSPPVGDTSRGDHYSTGAGFGNVQYRFVAIPNQPDPAEFKICQEVQVIANVTRRFQRSGLARAGTILSCDRGPGDIQQYLIRFPGKVSLTLPGTLLEPAPPAVADTSRGEVRGLLNIEEQLIDSAARIMWRTQRGLAQSPADHADCDALASALERSSLLPVPALARQLEGAIETRTQEYLRETRTAKRERLAKAPTQPAPRRRR